MKLPRVTCGILAIALSAVLMISGPILVCCGIHFLLEYGFTSQKKLLYETDHQAVLEVCRDLMAKHQRGEIPDRLFRNDPGFPDALRPLRPSVLYVQDDFVHMEMHGGADHYGFYANAEGSRKEGTLSSIKLIDGLWWYGDYP